MQEEDKLYGEILDMMLLLRDVAYEFKCYSANDIKKLIASKLKGVREVKALRHLYQLEEAIGSLRSSFSSAKQAKAAREAAGASLPRGTDVPVEQALVLVSHLAEQPFPPRAPQ